MSEGVGESGCGRMTSRWAEVIVCSCVEGGRLTMVCTEHDGEVNMVMRRGGG